MSVTIGFVGCGRIAYSHLGSIRENGDLGTVVGGADISKDARDAFAKEAQVPVFDDYRQMFDDTSPQAVILTTPASFREQVVAECARRGISVLMEKPLAHTVEHGERLVELAGNHPDIVCGLGYCHHFASGPRKIKSLFADGTLGDPIEMRAVFTGNSPQNATAWRTDVAVSGGGTLLDNGTHVLDIFHYIFGSVTGASAAVRRAWGEDRGEDSAFILARSESGAFLHATCSWLYPYAEASITAVGSKALAHYSYVERDKLIIRAGDEERIEPVEDERRFIRQMETFLKAVKGGDRGDLATFEHGLTLLRLVDNMYQHGM